MATDRSRSDSDISSLVGDSNDRKVMAIPPSRNTRNGSTYQSSSVTSPQRPRTMGANGGGGASPRTPPTHSHSPPHNRKNSLWDRVCGCCFCFMGGGSTHERNRRKSEFLYRMECTLKSRLYRFFAFFFTMILLFGTQVKNLWCPRSSDVVFDVIFVCAIGFFICDMSLRICVTRQYFVFELFPCKNYPHFRGSRGSIFMQYLRATFRRFRDIRFGSFLFWCDLISTVSLLYEISWFNRANFDIIDVGIVLDERGFPTNGLRSSDNPRLQRMLYDNLELFVTIGTTARVARFVRSSKVSALSSKINWYWCFQNCSWTGIQQNWKRLFEEQSNQNSGGTEAKQTTSYTARELWSNLAFMLTVANLNATQRRQMHPVFRKVRDALASVGFVSSQDEEFRRQIAAIKIQRAWRAELKERNATEISEHPSDNHEGTRTSMSTINTSEHFSKRNTRSGSNLNRDGTRRSIGHDNADGDERESSRSRVEGRSQVGSAMRELTGQRVAIGIIVTLVLTVLFTYSETDSSRASTMVVLHTQTKHKDFAYQSLQAARLTSAPDLFKYTFADDPDREFGFTVEKEDVSNLRDREILRITVGDHLNRKTVGLFAYRRERKDEALLELLSTIFILLVWLFGVRAFIGPIMILVVMPIERMIRLLGMLTIDPLGYQSTPRYKKFEAEEEKLTKNTRWTKEVLKGMETSFLMSTILRIGSLMKVGFGSAGVEIIRNNLAKGTKQSQNILSSKGTTVPCIFLFCDIRQFTDATESLQEEVFRFTNRIAAVVHSYCHAWGGAANKNVGDAFLLSWLLDEAKESTPSFGGADLGGNLKAKNHQADKALWSVVKITIALQDDEFYLETLSDVARNRLLDKLSTRKGPVVQMGCGLHAGTAVQGAIGSERKIDATYVSEAVEMAEFLESSTKKYGVKVLMSNIFHRLLDSNNRRRCRKVDQIILIEDDDNDLEEDEILDHGEVMELYTFDMDLDALNVSDGNANVADNASDTDDDRLTSRREVMRNSKRSISHKNVTGGRFGLKSKQQDIEYYAGDENSAASSPNNLNVGGVGAARGALASGSGISGTGVAAVDRSIGGVDRSTGGGVAGAGGSGDDTNAKKRKKERLSIQIGQPNYYPNLWNSDHDVKTIRKKYTATRFPFFQQFNNALQLFYAKDWKKAKQCFTEILEHFDDGPSQYFMEQIETNNGKPPPEFLCYGRV